MTPTPKFTAVLTRAAHQNDALGKLLEKVGFNVLALPLIEIQAMELSKDKRKIFESVFENQFDWLIFTSANAVEIFRDKQKELGEGKMLPSDLKIATQGSQSAKRVKEILGRVPDLMPETFTLEGLLESFQALNLKKKKILLAVAKKTRDVLEIGLEKCGAKISKVEIYETVPCIISKASIEQLTKVPLEQLVFLFLSSSAFEATHFALRESALLNHAKLVSIGPITSQVIEEAGYKVFFEAKDHTALGLVQGLREFLAD